MVISNELNNKTLVIVQLNGGNDFMNTVVPYGNGLYRDFRPIVGIDQEHITPIDDYIGFNNDVAPINDLYNKGQVAIIQGVGYPNSSRSHFRAMDIWHTCEPNHVATEGWLAKVIREIAPNSYNPVTAVNFGRGLPSALAAPGVIATSVGDLDNYGLMSEVEIQEEKLEDLEIFKRKYTPAIGSGMVMNYLGQTGRTVLSGADILSEAPKKYSSTIEYSDNPIAKSLRDVARVHFAGLGTRIFYTSHAGYDHHAQEVPTHARLLSELTDAISDFMDDLEEHDASEEVTILVFTEFGRRVKDNGSGTDHGSGGGAFLIGDNVKGGLYSEYPSLSPSDWLYGEDLQHTIDFRGIYGTILQQWMGIDPYEIVGGDFEQINPYKKTLI